MKNSEKLNGWAKEINNDWDAQHQAYVRDGELRVYFDHLLVATVNGNFDIEMHEEGHDEVVDQLNYMIER